MLISAIKLLEAEPVDVLSNFIGNFDILFEDGVVVKSTGMQLIISRYSWELVKKFPKMKLVSDYHISKYVKDETSFTSGSLINLHSKIINDIFDTYPMDCNEVVWELQSSVWEEYMRINNLIFNHILIYGGKYHVSLNVEDILDIKYDEGIMNVDKMLPINSDTIKDSNYIDNIYKQKEKIINSEKFINNNISIMLRGGVIKKQQLMQCLGPRGSVTDINSDIFKEPISVGYLDGFDRLYDGMIESRTAAMSLNNQSTTLKFTEYFSRRIQFIGMQLSNIHFGDCGTRHHLEFQVRDNRSDYVISDLELLEGMYYLSNNDEENPIYKPIHRNDHHLIGKRIKVRTILGCQHSDPYGVCSTCFGESSRQVPKYRNIGHFALISFTEIISQLVLSTKHHTGSAVASSIVLTEDMKQTLTSMDGGLAIGINSVVEKKYKSIKLVIPESSVEGLSDISEVKDIGILSPKRTSHIQRICIIKTDKDDVEHEEVFDVIPTNDVGYLSMHMLKHMKENSWVINKKGFIEIELIDFNKSLPIIEITPKQYNMFKYSKSLEKLIKSSVKDVRKRATMITPEAFLMELSDTVNQKIGINLSILQVIVYTMLATDIDNKDYSLPKPHTKRGLSSMNYLLWGRSLSAALAYERQGHTLNTPSSIRYKNRPDSPMDEFFTPEQMDLEYYKL